MLNYVQRRTMFVLFCLAILVLLGIEIYIVIAIIEEGFTLGKTALGVVSSGALFGCGAIFLRIVEANFLKRQILPIARLHRYASERNAILNAAMRSAQDEYDRRRALVSASLKLAEETLHGWLPGSHFELCIFVDADQPMLFAYFDSNHDSTARSMAARAQNPRFYIEQGYEVTKLLRAPTSQPRILQDTTAERAQYAFTSEQQRKQLRSTLLLCLDTDTPCALVATSNEANAFPDTDPDVTSFLRFIGASIRYDLFEEGFITRLRALKPELFAL